MHYDVFISNEGDQALAEFPDCPGCQTFSDIDDPAALADASYEALNGWLEAHLIDGQVPPRPMTRTTAPEGKTLSRVPVRAALLAALSVRWMRQDAGLSQRALGRRVGVSQQQIAKYETPDENPTLETLDRVARALDLTVDVSFERREVPTSAAVVTRTEHRRSASPVGSARPSRKKEAAAHGVSGGPVTHERGASTAKRSSVA
jgi:transcriptional regulator with XRE-family HTH domain/predicted RNase H-like HicB family nuclease